MKRRIVHGQSLVEMALVLPFLVTVFLGIVDCGYYVYTYSELENATRRASERASKTPPLNASNPNDANDKCMLLAEKEALAEIFLNDVNGSNFTFAFIGSGGRKVGDQVEVKLTYTGQLLTPVGSRFFKNVNFNFTSRRTITDIDAPRDLNADCSPMI